MTVITAAAPKAICSLTRMPALAPSQASDVKMEAEADWADARPALCDVTVIPILATAEYSEPSLPGTVRATEPVQTPGPGETLLVRRRARESIARHLDQLLDGLERAVA